MTNAVLRRLAAWPSNKDVRSQWAVVCTVCRTQGRNVISLRKARLPTVIRAPTHQLSEFSEGGKQLATGGLIVESLIQQCGDPRELVLGQRQHAAATSNVIHRP